MREKKFTITTTTTTTTTTITTTTTTLKGQIYSGKKICLIFHFRIT